MSPALHKEGCDQWDNLSYPSADETLSPSHLLGQAFVGVFVQRYCEQFFMRLWSEMTRTVVHIQIKDGLWAAHMADTEAIRPGTSYGCLR